jgi:hypothetical protein
VSTTGRIVSQLPLNELWDDNGRVEAERVGPVGAERIKQLLRTGEASFVVADIGYALRWVSMQSAAAFWKGEAKDHLADGESIYLGDFPGGYAYSATEWRCARGGTVFLLEAHH